MYHGGGARAGGGARQGAGPPRLQARQRDGQPRRPGARHGLRAGAAGREAGRRTARRGRDRREWRRREGGVVTTQRLPAPLAEPGAPIAPLDGSTLVLTPVSGDHAPARVSSRRRLGDVRPAADAHRRDDGNARVHGARAVPRPRDRRAHAISSRSASRSTRRCTASARSRGNTLMALTTNVVNGTDSRGAGEHQGAAVDPEDPAARPARERRRALPVDGGAARGAGEEPGGRAAAMAVGDRARCCSRWRFGRSACARGWPIRRRRCGGGPEKLAGIWELVPPGAAGDAAPGAAARRVS